MSLNPNSAVKHLLQLWKLPNKVRWTLVAMGRLRQIILVIVFCVIPLCGSLDLGRDGFTLVPLLSNLLLDLFSYAQLLVTLGEDGRAILSAGVGALSVQGGRVVHLEEKLAQLTVGDLLGVKDDQQ
jgi:uncharacterized membrane protein